MTRSHLPTKQAEWVFQGKAMALRLRRTAQDLLRPVHKHPFSACPDFVRDGENRPFAESITPLFTDPSEAEWRLQLGKIENLRLCARAFNGVIVPAGQVLSFWKQLGPPWSMRGFIEGREVREGCIIPTIAGGICQLSNALYDCALKANMTIHERHGHTAEVPGSATVAGRDATVFWNYVDLRFSHSSAFQVEVRLTETEHIVRFWPVTQDIKAGSSQNSSESLMSAPKSLGSANSCETCGVTSCFRNQDLFKTPVKTGLRTTALLDETWPEYNSWLKQQRQLDSTQKWSLCLSLDGARRQKAPYTWDSNGVEIVHDDPLFITYRSLMSRFGSKTPAARQARSLKLDRLLATRMAKRISYTSNHLIVAQSLLPWLHQVGVLGGRRYDVLMTRTPLGHLIKTLDEAAIRYPESPTLGDFRCDKTLIQLEAEALAGASRWLTPHHHIAKLAPSTVEVEILDWAQPSVPDTAVVFTERPTQEAVTIGLVGPTLGRKGAYLLKELVSRNTQRFQWIVLGETLEKKDFWDDLPVKVLSGPISPKHSVWRELSLVLEPAWVEHRPRTTLMAIAYGIPAVISPTCGIAPQDTVQVIDSIDVVAWETAIERALEKKALTPASSTESTMTAEPCNG